MISAVIKFKDDTVMIHSEQTESVGKKFQPGFYHAYTDSQGNMRISERQLNEIHEPYNTREITEVVKTVDAFFKKGVKKKVNALGFCHKLGVLMFGEQGTSKTSVANFIAKKLVVNNNAVCFICSDDNSLSTSINLGISIRAIQTEPIVFLADEFDRYCRNGESELKDFTDGNMSIDNSLILATTNYIDRVPESLKDRPSRFRVVVEIPGITDKKLMFKIIDDISKRISPNLFTEQEIWDEVKKHQKITLDKLKHICLDRVTNNYIIKTTNKAPTIGFNVKQEELEEQAPEYHVFTLSGLAGAILGNQTARTPTKPSNNESNI